MTGDNISRNDLELEVTVQQPQLETKKLMRVFYNRGQWQFSFENNRSIVNPVGLLFIFV